jgi:geranylgeranyl reductase family protein
MPIFDVAVIGGGPSGASAAITLAKLGYGVLIVDRAVFPRDKLCGDFINPVNWPILRELNVSQEVLTRQHAEVRKFRLTASNGTEAASSLPIYGAQRFGLGLRRYYLDHLLMERAKRDGASIVEGARIKRLVKSAEGWVLEFEKAGELVSHRSKIIVGADGRNSWVARRLGVAGIKRSSRGSVGFAIQLKKNHGLEGSVEIHQFPGGYAGLVRVDRDTVNLCFTIERSCLRQSVSFEALRNLQLNQNPFLRDQLADAESCGDLRSVSPVYFPPRKCFGDGFLLVGDAARVTEPVTGEGIYFALRSGQLAGKTIDSALRRKDTTSDCLRQYQRACREEFRKRFRLNYLTRVLAHHPSLLSSLIRFSAKRRRLLDSMVKSVCSLDSRNGTHEQAAEINA